MNVICSDKTGTLTKNEMTTTDCITADLQYAEFTGIGYRANGELQFTNPTNSNRIANRNIESFMKIFQTAVLCNNTQVIQGKLFGLPTEGALLISAEKLNIDVVSFRRQFTKLEEFPFNSEHKIMIVKLRSVTDYSELYHVKGALENVLAKCTTFYDNGRLTPLSDELKNQYIIESDHVLAKKGLRVLGFSFGESLDQQIFLGMVGILDPPRYGVEDSVRTLTKSGVQVKMVTGDAKGTATSIGILRFIKF